MESSNPLKAGLWMMGAVVSFVAMAVAGREIQAEMNTFELMLYRSAIGFAIVALLLAREIAITALRSIASSEGVVIAAGDDGKSKTALQMVGILCLILGYPYRLSLGPIDMGVVDLVYVGRALVYVSLVFSLLSAVSYVKTFAAAVEAKAEREG